MSHYLRIQVKYLYLVIYNGTPCILEEVKITVKKLICGSNHQNKWNASVVWGAMLSRPSCHHKLVPYKSRDVSEDLRSSSDFQNSRKTRFTTSKNCRIQSDMKKFFSFFFINIYLVLIWWRFGQFGQLISAEFRSSPGS